MGNGKNGNGKRRCEDWLTSYAEYTGEQESPALFHLWTGLSVIASTLERRVWINRGYYKLYPNLYVTLVGASARVRRTTAVNMGYNLFKEAITEGVVVSQKVTPEAFISIFMDGFKERQVSGGTVVSPEFGVFLGQGGKSSDVMQLLTDWYDCPTHWSYHTVMRGKEEMENVFCNLMASTTPSWLKDSMPPHAVGGGFTSRIIFVYRDAPERLVPFPEVNLELEKVRKDLMHDLRIIRGLSGEYRLTENAKEWYRDWYTKVFKPENTPYASLDGYYGRKHDTLLKLAVIFTVSKGGSHVITEAEIRMGLKALNENEKYLPQTIRLVQMTDAGEELEKVFRVIQRRKEVDHTMLMRQVSYCINAKRLDEVMASLIIGERVDVKVLKDGRKVYKIK